MNRTLENYKTCNTERKIIQVRIKTFRRFLNVIGVYASVEGRQDDSEEFYDLLQNILEQNPNKI
jgi:predicted nucleotidyltransferase